VARSGGLLFQVHDLTERKRAEANLAALEAERVKRQAVEMASALKSDFLGRVSHEMRTPLNAVIGLSQLLNLKQATMTTERMLSYADHIHTAGQHLLALVTDLLDLNQAAQGTLQLQLGTVGLAQVVEEAVGLVRVKAETQRVQLDTALAPGLHVRADAQRLRQVLLNLLSNAIKFSRPESRVLIRAEAAASGRVLLMVDDNGIGMTAAQMERLFEPFDRLGAESTQVPGAGLGLSISRSLVIQMQGTLHIDSVIDVGTTASVELPAA
jgi:signal transduction histidine kinase